MKRYNKECVWYCPQLDAIAIFLKKNGYIFTDEYGKYHMWYEYATSNTYNFYLIGKL